MAQDEDSRSLLREALAELESRLYLSAEYRDSIRRLINLILTLPDEHRRRRGEVAAHWSELSFGEYASLPQTPGDPTTRLQFLLQELEYTNRQMEWDSFLRHNDLLEE